MRTRTFGRLGWPVSEIGYGMWGIAQWSDADEVESRTSLAESVRLGVNFFDTAWAYGRGYSERLLGDVVRANPQTRLYTASKIPPKNLEWPPRKGVAIDEVFPPDHIREYTERTLENLGLSHLDLMQFHVWEDAWARDSRWQKVMYDLKREGLIGGVGVSVNRWEPWNVLDTLRTGLVDAVQVIYNVFDQAPEEELFPLCEELEVAVIARVPLDEGSLTGTLTKETTFPEGDFRAKYFGADNLEATVDRVKLLERDMPLGMKVPELALRFILSNPVVSTVIPGMRRIAHVRANAAVSDAGPLDHALIRVLRQHRWDREPAEWSA